MSASRWLAFFLIVAATVAIAFAIDSFLFPPKPLPADRPLPDFTIPNNDIPEFK